MEMRYFWLLDQQVQKYFNIQYHPGQENMGDYPSKAHTGAVHQHVRPWYIHNKNSRTELPRALKPSSRRGSSVDVIPNTVKLLGGIRLYSK